jgi:PAS domain S-box-containing protein
MSDITERKREEEALRQSEEKYRNILENIEEGYFEIDLAGNFTFFNDTVCRVLGYPREELIRMNNRHYTDKEEFKKVFQAYNKVYKTGEPNREFGQQITRKDGTKRYIEGSIFLQKDSSGKPIEFRGILRDITERKRAKEQYQEFVEKASDIVFRTDDSGHLTFINPVTLRVTGYSEEEILGKHFLTFIHPDLRDETSKFFGRQFVKGIKNTYSEYPIITKDGHEVWLGQNTQLIAEDGKVTGFQAVSRDITARKRMEEALHQSEEKYRTLLESVQEGYFEIDLAGNYTFFNDSLCRIYNYSKEELMGMNYRQYTDKETRKNGFHEFNKVYNTGEPLKGFTWPIIGKDKTKRYVETSASLLKDLSGKVIGFRGILHDITERKRAEEELKKYREQLEQLVRERTIKLEASNNELEAFSYSISHDLRAPLRAIDGFSHALLEDCEDKLDIQGKDYLIRIRAATQRMSTLIEDLLNLSRITRSGMNMEKVNLTRIVRSVINELQKSHPQRHVKIRIAEGLEDTADSRLIRIALENLLNNAWKFTAKQSETVIEFGSTKEGGKKVYFIRDNGAGFDMTYVDKLFAPFQRLHTIEEYPGTGIGLATVRRIIFRHGGKVRAEGQTGKGATFYFSLHE